MLTRDDASIWPGMSAPAKQAVKTEMLACIKEEQQRGVTKKVRLPLGWCWLSPVFGFNEVWLARSCWGTNQVRADA